MADYQAKINLLVSGQAQLKALTAQLKNASEQAELLDQKTRNLKESTKLATEVLKVTGREAPRGKGGRFAKDPDRAQRLAALRREREGFKEYRAAKRTAEVQRRSVSLTEVQIDRQNTLNKSRTKELSTQIQFDKTLELFNTRSEKFERGTPAKVSGKPRQQEVDRIRTAGAQLRQAFDTAKKGGTDNLKILKDMADAMGKLVEKQNELNRQTKVRTSGLARARKLQERIDELEGTGTVPEEVIKRRRKKVQGVITAANAGNATKFQQALESAEASVSALERNFKRVEQAQSRVETAQRSLNKLKRSEFADSKAIGSIQEKLNLAAEEAAQGKVSSTKRIIKEVRKEVDAQAEVVAELKKQESQRNKNVKSAKTASDRAAKDAKDEKNKRDKAARKAKQALMGTVTGAATGFGFPLLMGGPSFSAVGGGIGGLLGGLGSGAGLAGGIVGSALGSAIDTFTKKAKDLGTALRSPTENLNQIIDLLSIIGTETGGLISDLQKLGASEIAASVATKELDARLSKLGLDPERFKKQSTELDNALADLGLAMARLGQIALPLVVALTNAARNLGGASFGPDLGDGSAAGAVGGAASRSFGQTVEAFQSADEEAARTLLVQQRLDNQKEILVAKQQDLNIDKLQRATLEGNLAIQQKSRELASVQIRASFEKNAALKRQLILESDVLGIQLEQLKVQKENAEVRARQAIEFEVGTNIQSSFLKETQNRLQAIRDLTTDVTLDGVASPSELRREDSLAFVDTYRLQREVLEDLRQDQEEVFQERIRQVREEKNLNTQVRVTRIRNIEQEANAADAAINRQLRQLDIDYARIQTQKQLTQAAMGVAEATKIQELEAAKLSSALAQFNNFGPQNLFQGFGFFTESVNLADQKLLEFNQTLENYQTQIDTLQGLKEIPGITADQTADYDRQIKQLKAVRDAYKEIQPAINEVAIAQARFNDAFNLLNPVIQNAVQNFAEFAKGTRTAKEAFADMLNNMGQILAQQGATMIATYMAIGIARAFAGFAASGGSDVKTITDKYGEFGGTGAANAAKSLPPLPGKANGGPVQAGQPYMVGERGTELFVPGTSGGILRNDDMRQLMGRSPMGNTPQMNFSFETTSIGGQEFVSREQLEAAMATTRRQAANDGAKRGMNMTLDKMQNSPRTRSRVGIR